MHTTEQFTDRRQAGRALVEALRPLWPHDPIVLALPRGGVPVGYEIAMAFHAPLEPLLARKIGAPGHEEFALGAVIDGPEPQWISDAEMLAQFQPPADWFETQIQRQLAEIERRRLLYFGTRTPTPLRGRAVVLVDDGIATGSTALVSLQALRRQEVGRRLLAVPVAPVESLERLKPWTDELVCLLTPSPFRAVGLHYRDFAQTSDQEVVELLSKAREALALS